MPLTVKDAPLGWHGENTPLGWHGENDVGSGNQHAVNIENHVFQRVAVRYVGKGKIVGLGKSDAVQRVRVQHNVQRQRYAADSKRHRVKRVRVCYISLNKVVRLGQAHGINYMRVRDISLRQIVNLRKRDRIKRVSVRNICDG